MGTEVRLPASLLYPIEVIQTFGELGQRVSKHDPLFKFKYWNRVADGTSSTEEDVPTVTKEFYGTFESPFTGEIAHCRVQTGDKINDSETIVYLIAEGCDHQVQYGGLCAICGRELEEKDYMGYSETQRAPIAMSHDTNGLTVSRTEAERLELRSHQQLLASKRLILVVDLDQTVIHCAVNPEIQQWIRDPQSPNHDLVKDVKQFTIRERAGGRDQNCIYFVKVRPGLEQFLREMHAKYEMHVYTMATKQYALEIAKIIDPTGEYFADRILSRDASDNLVHKDLKRLFPVSTRMVTVIDDRGDVWNWSPNLIRVMPYQFWSGTGDINSKFLPHRNGLVIPDKDPQLKSDGELLRVGQYLNDLHTKFYQNPTSADVAKVLPAMKCKAFKNCVLLFSGFFSLDTDLDNADIVQWVRSFGAVVVVDFLPSVTHVIAKNPGTMKARQASGHKKPVVSIWWVFQCLKTWQHVDEQPYILEVENPIGPESSESQSLEIEPDGEVDSTIADGFMRGLQRGEVDWNELDEELKELLDDEDETILEEEDSFDAEEPEQTDLVPNKLDSTKAALENEKEPTDSNTNSDSKSRPDSNSNSNSKSDSNSNSDSNSKSDSNFKSGIEDPITDSKQAQGAGSLLGKRTRSVYENEEDEFAELEGDWD